MKVLIKLILMVIALNSSVVFAIQVPDLTGLTKKEARDLLKSNDLQLGEVKFIKMGCIVPKSDLPHITSPVVMRGIV